eukprot:GHVP01067976.1.p1 GENE.GHVP01067976.1~~GHVP01067976.1.p1  ORF type:complete len:216 (-),score=29.59 GHVP01067976.1:1291-1938(-)
MTESLRGSFENDFEENKYEERPKAFEVSLDQDSALGHAVLGLTGFLHGTRFLFHALGNGLAYNAVNLGMEGIFGGATSWMAGFISLYRKDHIRFNAWMTLGAFWFSQVLSEMLPYWGLWPNNPDSFLASFYIIWGIWISLIGSASWNDELLTFAALLTFGTSLIFLGMAFAILDGFKSLAVISGTTSIVAGLISMYATTALQINGAFKRRLLPFW